MSDVIYIRTQLGMADLVPEKVLSGALEAWLRYVTLIGRHSNGEIYMASSYGKNSDVVYDLEVMKTFILSEEIK